MANTYTLISSNVLSSSAASVTFSSIPSTYTDLVLKLSARDDGAAPNDNAYITFNNNSNSVYSSTFIYRNAATSKGSLIQSATTADDYNYVNSNGATSNTFSNNEIYIPNYAGSNNKPWMGFNVAENNSSTTGGRITLNGKLAQITSAINQITLFQFGSQVWLSGSSFYLYGIKNS